MLAMPFGSPPRRRRASRKLGLKRRRPFLSGLTGFRAARRKRRKEQLVKEPLVFQEAESLKVLNQGLEEYKTAASAKEYACIDTKKTEALAALFQKLGITYEMGPVAIKQGCYVPADIAMLFNELNMPVAVVTQIIQQEDWRAIVAGYKLASTKADKIKILKAAGIGSEVPSRYRRRSYSRRSQHHANDFKFWDWILTKRRRLAVPDLI